MLPEWFENHCIKEDTVINNNDYYFVLNGSPNLTINNGSCGIYGKSTPNIIVNKGGKCMHFNYSRPSNIIVNKKGYLFHTENYENDGISIKWDDEDIMSTIYYSGYDSLSPYVIVNDYGGYYMNRESLHMPINIYLNKDSLYHELLSLDIRSGYEYINDSTIFAQKRFHENIG